MSNFIKDSANNYTLYVNQGTDFEFSVSVESLNVLPNDTVDILALGSGFTLALNSDLDILALEDTAPEVENTEYLTGLEVFSVACEHITSKKKFDFLVQKDVVSRTLTFRLPADTTTSMNKPRYGFDVVGKDDTGITRRLFGGTIIMSSPYTLL